MSLAVLCSQCFALRGSETLSVIIDTPTPPNERGSLADQKSPLPGTRSFTISPAELDTRQRRAHVCSAVQVTRDERPRDGGIKHIPQALPLPTMRAVNHCCRAGRS